MLGPALFLLSSKPARPSQNERIYKTMNYDTIAQPWQQNPQNAPRLPMPANSPFFLKHHPKNWELVEFKQKKQGKKAEYSVFLWLPVLHVHWEAAGVEGTRGSGDNVDSTLAKAKYNGKGWTILEPSRHDYLRIYPAIKGNYYSDKWTTIENLAGEIVTTYNHDENNNWRRELVKNGAVQLPHEQILKRLIHNHSRMISNKAKFQHIPENKKKLDALYDINKEMTKAMDAVKSDGVDAYEL